MKKPVLFIAIVVAYHQQMYDRPLPQQLLIQRTATVAGYVSITVNSYVFVHHPAARSNVSMTLLLVLWHLISRFGDPAHWCKFKAATCYVYCLHPIIIPIHELKHATACIVFLCVFTRPRPCCTLVINDKIMSAQQRLLNNAHACERTPGSATVAAQLNLLLRAD